MTDNNQHRRERDAAEGSGLRRAAKILAVGAAAAGAAAAGYYFYASKNANRNRRVVARWATDFKNDVMRQAGEMEHLDREAIIGIIDGVSRAYGKMRNLNHADLREAAEELKHNWRRLSSELDRRDARLERSRTESSRSSARRPSRSKARTRTSASHSESASGRSE